jgi:hypothetical protein
MTNSLVSNTKFSNSNKFVNLLGKNRSKATNNQQITGQEAFTRAKTHAWIGMKAQTHAQNIISKLIEYPAVIQSITQISNEVSNILEKNFPCGNNVFSL